MAEYIVRIIGYGLLLFVNGMIYYFLHSQFYFLVLVLMVAGPILSAMSVWVLRHYLQVEIHHAQDSYGVQGETAYFTIQIKNPTWFVSLDTKLIDRATGIFRAGTCGKRIYPYASGCGDVSGTVKDQCVTCVYQRSDGIFSIEEKRGADGGA